MIWCITINLFLGGGDVFLGGIFYVVNYGNLFYCKFFSSWVFWL